MRHQILIAGVGGQGVLLLTKLLYTAAMIQGDHVFAYEIHGMSQRGGSVFSSLKIGSHFSPQLFPEDVDTIIALESSEVFSHIPYLKKTGQIVLNSSTLTGKQADWLDQSGYSIFRTNSDSDAMKIGNPRVSNLVLLGKFMDEHPFILEKDSIVSALKQIVKPAFLNLNIAAFKGNY